MIFVCLFVCFVCLFLMSMCRIFMLGCLFLSVFCCCCSVRKSPYALSEDSLTFAFEAIRMFVWLTMALSRPFSEGRRALPLSTPLSSRRSMAWVPWLCACPQVVSQAPQHFRSSETQVSCDCYFSRHSICSVVSLHSGVFRAVHPQAFPKVPIWAFHSTFHFL